MGSEPKLGEDWHEAASVTVTRLICQLVIALVVLGGAVVILLNHPEFSNAALLCVGVVLGAYFGASGLSRRVR